MKKIILGLVCVLFLFVSVPGDILRGPYLSCLTTTSIRITYETNDASDTRIRYSHEGVYRRSDTLSTEIYIPEPVTHHTVEITGLSPGSRYFYRVLSGDSFSPVDSFLTAPTESRFSFLVFGDNRTDSVSHQAVVDAMMEEEGILFVINGGDLVAAGYSVSDWQTFFNIERDLLASYAYYPVLGNHEIPNEQFINYFELPGNERYFSWVIGNCKFIILNTNESYLWGSSQRDWFESELAASGGYDYTFVVFHHPAYSSGNHGSTVAVQLFLVPLMEDYAVDFVFNSHDHSYEHAYVNGIHYLVSGGGGAPLYSVGTSDWTIYSESVHHYIRFDVDGENIRFYAKRPDGSIMDSLVMGSFGIEGSALPDEVSLSAYPNPFNLSVRITLSGRDANVPVDIFDIRGERVVSLSLLDGEAIWAPDNLPAGVYFATIRIDGQNFVDKLVYLK
ncbi:metallophosphoesterase [bacterium]|nr:metallophosphoesterase [bacterium]